MSAKGKALVTGASRGIGRAIAEALASDGWEVIGTCRNPRKLSTEDRRASARWLPLDLGAERSIDALVRAVKDVDLLVSSAGESPIGPAEEVPARKAREHFQVNFFGPMRLAQGLLSGMRRKRSGMIVFIGSIRSEVPTPFSSMYSASKAALESFGECLRLELLGSGVRVVVAAPWYVRTSLPQELVVKKGSPYAETVAAVKRERDRMIARAPDPRTVADRVLRLVGSRNPPPFIVIGRPLLTFLLRHAPRRFVAARAARAAGLRPVQREKPAL